jgi:RHS repeat-associated protein
MLSPDPVPLDFISGRFFEEPLVPIGADPTPDENAALASALQGYSARSGPDDFSSLTGFINAYPASAWNAALLTNLGLEYYNTGHYSQTLEAWSEAWRLAKASNDPFGKAIADRAVGELAYMYARLGRMSDLDALLKSVEYRVFSGPATERIVGAREGLWNMRNRPEISFRCGPLALHRLMVSTRPENPGTDLIHATASTRHGFSLPQVAKLSQQLGLNFQMAFREKGAALVAPSVVHWKVDHFAALVRQEGDRYLLQDPTFRNDMWVTREALESESSGYFLIPPGALSRGWRAVEEPEGETIWGKGNVNNPDPDPHGPCDPHTQGAHSCDKPDPDCEPVPRGGASGGGMAVPRVHLLVVSLNINDEPLGYTPPAGPEVRFMVCYNQRDARQPSIFTYSNFGPKWTFDWLSYVTDNPHNPLADVTYYIMGGGTRTFAGFNNATQTYEFQQLDQTKLTRTSPTSYEMLSRDGTRKLFSQSDGVSGTSRRIFLARLIDPYGNAVALSYDADLRITTITDAIGQITSIFYEHPTDKYKITKVADPFGRFATFEYDTSLQPRLVKITDVIGITSEFAYDAPGGDFIKTLSTPYGVTRFTKSENGTTRSLETVYPDGERDRVEFNQSTNLRIPGSDPAASVPGGMATFNQFLFYRNTFYWSKQACAYAYGDYTKAKIYHWLHRPDGTTAAGVIESIKEPLENRVWHDYTGQSFAANGPIFVGNTNKPAHIGRVLDDGSTQLYTYEYNDFGNLMKMIDPEGRTFSYIYADNGIDLLEVRQTRAGQSQLLSQTTYNDQHLPLTSRDAAGQVTKYTYNARGHILTRTDAQGNTTTYNYDAKAYRTSVVGPLGDTTTWTYDTMGRIRTKTDESGYTLTFDYDPFDRLTKITYPDGTFDQFTYTLLDRTLVQDRAGRIMSFEFNQVQQMTKRTDALNRVTFFEWCKCGALRRLTDPMGRTTTWRHDVQGRVKSKEYADGSKVSYVYENTTSRMRLRIDEKLQVTQHNYKRDDMLRGKTYTNASVSTPAVAFNYDPNHPRMTSMSDGVGTTLYRYIPITPIPALGAGQVAFTDGPLPNDTITFGYDEVGRRVLTAINGVASSSAFDAGGRVTSVTNALGTFNYAYDGNSFRETSQSYPNGQVTDRTYADNLHELRLERITHRRGGTPISQSIYNHDVVTGQITSWSEQSGTEAPDIYDFGYDAVDQLTSATVSQGTSVLRTFNYTYDPAGNRLSEQIDATTSHFSYNALNELTSSDVPSGNAATYEWDAENRLTRLSAGNQSTQFAYDGLGRRVGIRQLVNGSEASNRWFVWCDNEICEERTPSGAVSKRFFDQGMKMEIGLVTGVFFYTRDHLGSVRDLTDDAGTVRARYSYDPCGRVTFLEGDLKADFGFAGMFRPVEEPGLYLALFRAYDPKIGRWLTRDPLRNAEIKEGPSLYAYVSNNPTNRVDLWGLETCCIVEEHTFHSLVDIQVAVCSAYGIGWACVVATLRAVLYANDVLIPCQERCPPSPPTPPCPPCDPWEDPNSCIDPSQQR